MSVQTEFWNWQTAPMSPDPRTCSPLLRTLNAELRRRWGGQDLGCWVSRPVQGGTSPSSHASGAATDWRYQDPGAGRARMLDETMPWLLNQSRDLGAQAVHDYVGCRIWRPPGTSGRPAGGVDAGWRQQTPGSQMGQPWALWIHVEVLNTRWSDTRTIDQMLAAGGGGTTPTPAPDQEVPAMSTFTILAKAANSSGDVSAGSFWAGNGAVRIWVNGSDFARNMLPGAVDASSGREVTSWDNVAAIPVTDIDRLLGRWLR